MNARRLVTLSPTLDPLIEAFDFAADAAVRLLLLTSPT